MVPMDPIVFLTNTRCNILFAIPYKGISWLVGILRSGITKKITSRHLERFVASQATNESVLDLGCANSPYAKYFPRRIALDIAKRGDSGLDVVGEAHCLPLRSGSFSMVLATEILEHVREPQQVIDEISRILVPGGRLVLTTRFVFPLHDAPHDFFRFTKYGLKHLFNDWNDVRIIPESNSFESVAILIQRLVFQCDFKGSRLTKMFLLLIAHTFKVLNILIDDQYGDISRRHKEDQVGTSGYYVVEKRHINRSTV